MKNDLNNQYGFTLVELMVTLVVAAILAMLAAPSFTDLIRNNRLTTQTNYFVTALSTARSEAVKRNQRVVLCKRNAAGTQCDNAVSWQSGWLVFEDANADGDIDAGDSIIRVFEALRNGYTLVPATAVNWVAYDSGGMGLDANGGFPTNTFGLCAADALSGADANRSRSVAISASGGASVMKGATCP